MHCHRIPQPQRGELQYPRATPWDIASRRVASGHPVPVPVFPLPLESVLGRDRVKVLFPRESRIHALHD